MANKVVYGLKNVHFFPIENETTTDITYGSPIKVSGAVNMSLEPSGDDSSFYADDTIYYSEFSNNGYSGDLEIANLPEEVELKILGYLKDTNGAIVEGSNAVQKPFAMAFEFKGDKSPVRHILYYVTINRPKIESSTKEEKTKFSTAKLKFKAIPDKTGYIKSKVESGNQPYENFYKSVYKPTGVRSH